jgi:hypothetical protein
MSVKGLFLPGKTGEILTFKDCGADGWLKKAEEKLATLS